MNHRPNADTVLHNTHAGASKQVVVWSLGSNDHFGQGHASAELGGGDYKGILRLSRRICLAHVFHNF